MMKQKLKLLIAGSLIVGGARFVAAAPTQGEIELSRATVQVQRKALVAMNMNLDESQAAKFWPLYNDYQEAYRKVDDRFSALMTDYATNWMSLSEDKAKELMDSFFSIRMDQLKIRKSYAKKLSRTLSPKVAARFFQIENKLDAIIAADLADKVPLVH